MVLKFFFLIFASRTSYLKSQIQQPPAASSSLDYLDYHQPYLLKNKVTSTCSQRQSKAPTHTVVLPTHLSLLLCLNPTHRALMKTMKNAEEKLINHFLQIKAHKPRFYLPYAPHFSLIPYPFKTPPMQLTPLYPSMNLCASLQTISDIKERNRERDIQNRQDEC